MNNKLCRDFMENKCTRSDCKFGHIDNVCYHYWKNSKCKFGESCKKSHQFTKNYKQHTQRKHVKNTECFEPLNKPVDMHIIIDNDEFAITKEITSRDVVIVPNAFKSYTQRSIYNDLLHEIENSGIDTSQLFKLWHGNDKIEGTHLIADDKINWKDKCPTFDMVINRLCGYFNMIPKATRLNYYKDTSQWKPFHRDAAAVKPEKAKEQNFTVAVSFGATREAAFEHIETKCVISTPQSDGCIYAFANDTNFYWRHGILQDLPVREEGRISIIVWGWVDNIKNIN